MIGKSYSCTDATRVVSEDAINATTSIWKGYHTTDGKKKFFGLPPSGDLTSSEPHAAKGMPPAIWIECGKNNTCANGVNGLAAPWYPYYLLKDSQPDISRFTHDEFDDWSQQGIQQYESLVETDDLNLSKFKAAGGKMLTFHGLVSYYTFCPRCCCY